MKRSRSAKRVATLPLTDSVAPEGYTAADLAAISAEDDYNRLHEYEALVRLLARRQAQSEAAFVVPEGVVEIHYNGSKFADDAPDSLQLLEDRLKRWTLSRNYAHYCVCADGLTMFAGNFEEYAAGFHVDTRTGSDADRWLTGLMLANPGWAK